MNILYNAIHSHYHYQFNWNNNRPINIESSIASGWSFTLKLLTYLHYVNAKRFDDQKLFFVYICRSSPNRIKYILEKNRWKKCWKNVSRILIRFGVNVSNFCVCVFFGDAPCILCVNLSGRYALHLRSFLCECIVVMVVLLLLLLLHSKQCFFSFILCIVCCEQRESSRNRVNACQTDTSTTLSHTHTINFSLLVWSYAYNFIVCATSGSLAGAFAGRNTHNSCIAHIDIHCTYIYIHIIFPLFSFGLCAC